MWIWARKKLSKIRGKSLLPIGIKSFDGIFQKGDVVAICDSKKVEIARGLSNYDSECLRKIIGKSTKEIKKKLKYSTTKSLYTEII